jgi:hypothetical protein
MPVKFRVLLEPGDCFSIPLRDGRFAFGQYVHLHPVYGTLIRVFDLISTEVVPPEVLARASLRFPPIFVGLNPPVRMGRWRKIGHTPIDDFLFPKFRCSFERRIGINHDWKIWDGERYEKVGDLPVEYRSLEFAGTYAYGDVEERILTGRNPFAEGVE